MKIFSPLYQRAMQWARHRRAPWFLGGLSFAESSFFPIPPDIMLIPMAIAKRARAFWFATIATIGSVLGGIAGYAIGYFLFDLIGKPVLDIYGYGDKFQTFAVRAAAPPTRGCSRSSTSSTPAAGSHPCTTLRSISARSEPTTWLKASASDCAGRPRNAPIRVQLRVHPFVLW